MKTKFLEKVNAPVCLIINQLLVRQIAAIFALFLSMNSISFGQDKNCNCTAVFPPEYAQTFGVASKVFSTRKEALDYCTPYFDMNYVTITCNDFCAGANQSAQTNATGNLVNKSAEAVVKGAMIGDARTIEYGFAGFVAASLLQSGQQNQINAQQAAAQLQEQERIANEQLELQKKEQERIANEQQMKLMKDYKPLPGSGSQANSLNSNSSSNQLEMKPLPTQHSSHLPSSSTNSSQSLGMKQLPTKNSTQQSTFGTNISQRTQEDLNSEKSEWDKPVNAPNALGQAIKLNDGKMPAPPATPQAEDVIQKSYDKSPQGIAMNQKLEVAQKKYDELNNQLHVLKEKLQTKTATDADDKQYNQLVNIDLPKTQGDLDMLQSQKKVAVMHFGQSLQIENNTGTDQQQNPAGNTITDAPKQ